MFTSNFEEKKNKDSEKIFLKGNKIFVEVSPRKQKFQTNRNY